MMSRILPLVGLLIAAGLFFGYISPTFTGSVTKLQNEITGFDSALAASHQFTLKENELIAERNAIPADALARLDSFLPDGVDNVQLILDLDALAARSGIQLSNFSIQSNVAAAKSPGASAGGAAVAAPVAADAASTASSIPLSKGTPTDSLDLTVTAIGSYDAFRTFLAGIERSLRPLDIVNLTVKDSATGVYTYDITIRIYWLH